MRLFLNSTERSRCFFQRSTHSLLYFSSSSLRITNLRSKDKTFVLLRFYLLHQFFNISDILTCPYTSMCLLGSRYILAFIIRLSLLHLRLLVVLTWGHSGDPQSVWLGPQLHQCWGRGCGGRGRPTQATEGLWIATISSVQWDDESLLCLCYVFLRSHEMLHVKTKEGFHRDRLWFTVSFSQPFSFPGLFLPAVTRGAGEYRAVFLCPRAL